MLLHSTEVQVKEVIFIQTNKKRLTNNNQADKLHGHNVIS